MPLLYTTILLLLVVFSDVLAFPSLKMVLGCLSNVLISKRHGLFARFLWRLTNSCVGDIVVSVGLYPAQLSVALKLADVSGLWRVQ